MRFGWIAGALCSLMAHDLPTQKIAPRHFRRDHPMLQLLLTLMLFAASPALAQANWPRQNEADAVFNDFAFASGERLSELKLHYLTLGGERRNEAGEITNAVLLLHGTSGTSKNWLMPSLANELFAPGAPLDAEKYFIVIPDGIGRGGSSKPSDGLRMKFPHYRYGDMIAATHRLLSDHLGIKHLKLVLGTSMGGMQSWMWGEMYPDFMDALMPIASQPISISGRNWMYRRIGIAAMMTESPLHFQQVAPNREAMDALYRQMVERAARQDANNQLYATEAVMDYDPSKDLEKIKAKLVAINFTDDEVNPPELGVVEREIKRIANARLVMIPASENTHGHFTYNLASFWKQHLVELMKELPPPK